MKGKANSSWVLDWLLGGALWLPLVALIAAPIGCAEDDLSEDGVDEGAAVAPAAEVDDEAVADRDRRGEGRRHGRHHRGHHGRGMRHHDPAGKLLKTALKELELSDEQRATLEGLRERTRDGKAERHGRHADKRGHHEALIKALETGEVDEAACEAKVDGLGEKIERKLAERNERLATLHATLTPEQRATLVEQVRAKFADLAEHRADKGTGGFHGKGHHGPQMIKKLTAGLELTAEQRAQIDELVEQAEAKRPTADQIAGKIEEKKARVTELLDAFAAAEFDPAKLTAPQPMKHLRDRKACHQDQLEGLIDILTSEQRAELAEQIKSKPFGKHGCRGKGGCDGMGGCGKADCDGMGGCGRGKKHGPGDGSGPRAKTGDCPYANAE